MAGGWTAEMMHALVSVWGQANVQSEFRVSWTEWFGIERYAKEYLHVHV